MNRETFVTDTHAITKLAAAIFAADGGAAQGRSTYLRSLLAGTQAELAGKPVLRVSGRPKRPGYRAATHREREAHPAGPAEGSPSLIAPAGANKRPSRKKFLTGVFFWAQDAARF